MKKMKDRVRYVLTKIADVNDDTEITRIKKSLPKITLTSLCVVGVLIFTGLTGCVPDKSLSGTALSENKTSKTSIEGKVEFPKAFKVKADIKDIAASSTVTLLYPSGFPDPVLRNVAVATGLTDSMGKFHINPSSLFNPKSGEIYLLSAQKRLNGPGNNIQAINTFIRWTGSNWDSITGKSIFINNKTTALAIISSYDVIPAEETIAKIGIENGATVV